MKPLIARLLSISSFVVCSLVAASSARGQVTPDNTLGTESSVVTPDVINGIRSAVRIDGGATRGANLFHSFQEFNVGEGLGVYFSNPTGIENILTRVTGVNVSNIQGTLGVLGNANLFLLNPNGIVFGPGARLDLGGSFLGTTANSLVFNNGFAFSATNPEAPPLLTINMPLGLQSWLNSGDIVNQSSLLAVPSGETLGLVGGGVNIDGSLFGTLGGRIELGGVAGNGVVNITPTDTGFTLDYSGVQDFRDISLSGGADAVVGGEGGGSIQVQGAAVTVTEGSSLSANTTGSGNGGEVSVNASESVEVSGSGSGLFAQVFTEATGDGGNITISTPQLKVTDDAQISIGNGGIGNGGELNIFTGQLLVEDGSQINASTFSTGNAGNVKVNATESITLMGVNAQENPSGLFATVNSLASGDGGNLTISTPQLIVTDGADVSVSTFGEGDGGNLLINATDSIEISGSGSGLVAQVEPGAMGNGGNITISTPQLIVIDNAQVSVTTFGEGNAGDLSVNASELVEVSDGNLGAQVNSGASGDGGNLTISTPQLIVTDGAQISANNSGIGNGGELNIFTGQLLVEDGSQINAGTFSTGNAGNVTVNATESITLMGADAQGNPSGLFTTVNLGASGDGGNLTISTPQLIVIDGADVSVSTFGEGDGGNLLINATDSIEISGSGSSLGAQVEPEAMGNGGNITISTPQLIVTDDAQISANNLGIGNGGELNIFTGQLFVEDGSQIAASTFSVGNAGNVTVNATESITLMGVNAQGNPSGLFAQVAPEAIGAGGNITVSTPQLTLTDDAEVSVSTFGEGDAGDLFIKATDSVEVSGSGLVAQVESEATGEGGSLTIETPQLIITDGGQVSVTTLGEGDAGDLFVNATDSVKVSGSFLVAQVESEAIGDGGSLTIETPQLIVTDGANVTVSTFGEGDAGDLFINVSDSVEVSESVVAAQVESEAIGDGGSLTISTGKLRISNQGQVSVNTFGMGDAGDLFIQANQVEIFGSASPATGILADVLENAVGKGGNITIETQQLSIADDGEVSASALIASGTAGDININGDSIFLDNQGNISTETVEGDSGNINLFSSDLRLQNNSNITTNAQNITGGNIFIDTDTLVATQNSDITANAEEGPGGSVTINAQGIFGGEFREAQTPESDITATSNLGPEFNGQVILNTPEVDPTSGLTELPASPIDAEAILANDPCAFKNDKIAGGSSFTITGRGGLRPNADDPVFGIHRTVRWRSRPDRQGNNSSQESKGTPRQSSVLLPNLNPPQQLVEATGWYRRADGVVVLTADVPNTNATSSGFPTPECQIPQ